MGFMRWTEPETDWKKAGITPAFMKSREKSPGWSALLQLLGRYWSKCS